VLQADTKELLEGVALVAAWTSADGNANDAAAVNRRARELAAAYQRMNERDPVRVEQVAAGARAYARTLRRLGIRNPWAVELEPVRGSIVAWYALRLLVYSPFAVIGAILGWIPYRFAGWLAARKAGSDDVLGTAKLLAGMLFVGGAWIVESIAAGVLFGAVWSVPTFLVAAATGYLALRFQELAGDAAEWARAVWLRARHGATIDRLTARRRQLAGEVADTLREIQ